MTCADARERFSDLVDDRLAAADRITLDAHLGGCAACRRELKRFRATVALVRSIEPARAPAGFVDRVTAAARPRPWWRRVADGAFFPLPIKLPIEAAAILLVGVGVAYLFQRTPELQQQARVETPAITQEAPREAPADQPAAPAAKPDMPRPFADAPEPPRVAEERRAIAKAPASPPPAATAPAAPEPLGATGAKREDAPGARANTDAVAPSRARDEAKELARPDARQRAAKLARPADVTASLRVASRPAAESALRELVTRHRGAVDAMRTEPGATVVEARIPRDEYASFAAGLAALGRSEPARETEADLPAEVRVTIRLE
ncbi:MAG: zf-HC2 domain-containing protein [Candidatus Rokubacteria bacterium]|nr:zf-HC2 domain-containing protein [Candidatus Rokubacteria bacterium]